MLSEAVLDNAQDRMVSDQTIFAPYQNAGICVFDISDAYRPEEIDAFVPPVPRRLVDHRHNRPLMIQSCGVFVSREGPVYSSDYNSELYILEDGG